MAQKSFFRSEGERLLVKGIGYVCLAGTALAIYNNPPMASTLGNIGVGLGAYATSAMLSSAIILTAKHAYEDFKEKQAEENAKKKLLQKDADLSKDNQLGRFEITDDNKKYVNVDEYNIYMCNHCNLNKEYSYSEDWGFEIFRNNYKNNFEVLNEEDKQVVFFDKNQGYHIELWDGKHHDNNKGTTKKLNEFSINIDSNDERGFEYMKSLVNAMNNNDKMAFLETSSQIRNYQHEKYENKMAEQGMSVSEDYVKRKKEEKEMLAKAMGKFHFEKPNKVSLKMVDKPKEREPLEKM